MGLQRVFVALLLGCSLLVAGSASAGDPEYGRVWRGDGVLKGGCQDYGFRYRVKPGPHDWGAEFFLIGPGRKDLASAAKLSGADPKRGRGSFEVCRTITRPGKFKIRGKLTITKGVEPEMHWLKPTRFRLRRP